VNIVTDYEELVFTVSMWQEEKNDEVGHPKAEVVRSSHFPFLDMKMTWSEEGDLRFGVYLLKPEQELKYLKQRQLTPPSLLQSDYERCLWWTGKSDLIDKQIPVHVDQGLIPPAPQST
jgi:hypothetical protein